MKLRGIAGIIAGLAIGLVPVRAQQAEIATRPAHRPAADFATLPYLEGPRLSPDGSRIAARSGVGGKQVLTIASLFENKPPVSIDLNGNDLLEWRWVNDNWLVIRVGNEGKVFTDPVYVARLMTVSADGKTVNPVSPRDHGLDARVVWTATDGSPRFLMQRWRELVTPPEVDEVDAATGALKTVVPMHDGIAEWTADVAGNVRVGIGYSGGRTMKLFFRPPGATGFKLADQAKLGDDDDLLVPILGTEGQPAMIIARPDGNAALYEFDPKSFSLGKRVFGIDGYDIDGVVRDPRSGGIDGVVYTSDTHRIHWFNPGIAAVQDRLDKAVPGRAATIVSFSADKTGMIVHVGGADRPGSYYYYNTAGAGTMNRLSWFSSAIKGDVLSPVGTFRYKARDGLPIEAVLTLPRNAHPGPLPLILMPHGGPQSRDGVDYDWMVQFLADRGYAVVQPNFRGSTGYGRAFLDAGDREWGLKMQDDLNDAVDALAARGTINPKRVCIVGASYGGYAAMRAAQRDGARYRCAISFAGISDLPALLRYNENFLYAFSKQSWKRTGFPDLSKVSPGSYPEQFTAPILIVHGKKDLRVPVAQSRKLAEKLKAAGKPYEYVEQPEGDHYFSRQADRLQFLEAMDAFLTKYNPAG